VPIYEYVCEGCGAAFELLLRGGEHPACPACGCEKLARQLSVPAAHTSGSASQLPVCQPAPAGGCGLPQCGMGGCQF